MRKKVIQRHHITYPDGRNHPPAEWVVPVSKGEHFILTRLQWLKSVSPGFVKSLLYELARKEVTDLRKEQQGG